MTKPLSPLQRQIFNTGTADPSSPARVLVAGDISAVIDAGALRRLAFGPVELLRQIDFPIRDENWATLPVKVTREKIDERSYGFRYERHFDVGEGALSCKVTYEVGSDGVVTAIGEATATRDFVTNRAGFTLLHPIAGVAGKTVQVTNSAGESTSAQMPDTISPGQPVKDISGLMFAIEGLSLDIAFSGDVFEMEDQRNWSDASFKTYSRPLSEPFPYDIKARTTIRQEIKLRITGHPASTEVVDRRAAKIGAALGERIPEIVLATEPDWIPSARELETLRTSSLKTLLLRTSPPRAAADLASASSALEALSGSLDLEVVLKDTVAAEPQMKQVASACRAAGLLPKHVTALPKAYLQSYQPSGQWPEGLSPQEAYAAARLAFPDARIGSGMLTNFTEFNRCPPEGLRSDFITHGNSAIVHAADDWSVSQTLETLPDIFGSARKIGGDRRYRLGLTSIGMRSNPYGTAVTPNKNQTRLTMATWDPRARSIFGAAWAVAALAATEGFNVEAMALAAPTGPFGIVAGPVPFSRPWFDRHPKAKVYPMFHALRFLAGGGQRLTVPGLPSVLQAAAFVSDSGPRLVVANLSGQPQELNLAGKGVYRILDADHFEAAAIDPDWLNTPPTVLTAQPIPLASPAILFVELD
ncbi:hypothetical protein [Roseibium algae]|uniref:Uncharacterized protein n=1 Tax=Roseibium algae TaxID=3123038 RepID=A0ABU8TI18_9HYPH